MNRINLPSRQFSCKGNAGGFSLVELMVAVAVFLIVSGAAFTLFNYQQTVLMQQQQLSGLNIAVRNALTQIQLDGANAANGLILGAYAPAWPVGAVILNQNPTTPCNTGAPAYQFGANCFDELILILADKLTPACNIAGTGTVNLSSAPGTFSVTPVPPATAAQYAPNFLAGDNLMVVSSTTQWPPQFTTITLTKAASAVGSNIVLNFTPVSSSPLNGGVNPMDSPCPPAGSGLCLTTNAPSAYLNATFNAGSDWVIRLAPVYYFVTTSSPASANDPQLMRQVWGGSPVEVMDQVVIFKVGASLVNDGTGNYYYNANNTTDNSTSHQYGGYGNDFTVIRTIRINLMARTPPNGALSYRNQFDGGPYQILGASVVVNPRNLSMNDQ